MFAFALWDEASRQLFCARDRFGIKPLLLRVRSATSSTSPPRRRRCCRSCRAIETDLEGLKDYLAFQFCLAGKTLFKGVRELLPGHCLRVRNGHVADPSATGRSTTTSTSTTRRSTSRSGSRRCSRSRSRCTCAPTCRSAPTSAAASTRASSRSLASREHGRALHGVHRHVPGGRRVRRERVRARRSPSERGLDLHEVDIGVDDFVEHDRATSSTTSTTRSPGPGSFPQYMVSAGWPRSSARWSSAARAATRSSAATRAT